MDLRSRLAERLPLFGLAVRTPWLELRLPTDDELLELAALSTDIHEPDLQPFDVPWDQGSDEEVQRRLLTYHWARRGDFAPEAWRLELATVVDGAVVGTQGVYGSQFAITRTVVTGSWLGRQHQGRGIGTEMRAAVLHLAFAGLDALRAETGAFEGNGASLAVTSRLGYRPSGDRVHASSGVRRRELRFVMERADWENGRRDDIELVGLEACLPLFGLSEA